MKLRRYILCSVLKRTLFSPCKYHTYLFHLSLIPEKVDERELFFSLGISFRLFLFQYANPLFLSFFYRNYIYLIARGFLFLFFNEEQKKGMPLDKILSPKESLDGTGKKGIWWRRTKQGWVEGKVDITITRLSLMYYRALRVFINTNHRETGIWQAVGGMPMKEEEEQEVWLLIS